MKVAHKTQIAERSFIRHPSDIPIEVEQAGNDEGNKDCLRDIGLGGLSFHSESKLSKNDVIVIRVSLVQPAFETQCRVVWCRDNGKDYDVGVEFLNHEDTFRARMVEQVCHIEHYKKVVESSEGRLLTGEEAAEEWIDKFAAEFPQLQR